MLAYFIAFLLAFACPNHNNPKNPHGNGGQVTVLDDTGGETGHIPPNGPGHP